jgi:hypothetical protein
MSSQRRAPARRQAPTPAKQGSLSPGKSSSVDPSQSLSRLSHRSASGSPSVTLQPTLVPSSAHSPTPTRRQAPTPSTHTAPRSGKSSSASPSQSSSRKLQASAVGSMAVHIGSGASRVHTSRPVQARASPSISATRSHTSPRPAMSSVKPLQSSSTWLQTSAAGTSAVHWLQPASASQVSRPKQAPRSLRASHTRCCPARFTSQVQELVRGTHWVGWPAPNTSRQAYWGGQLSSLTQSRPHTRAPSTSRQRPSGQSASASHKAQRRLLGGRHTATASGSVLATTRQPQPAGHPSSRQRMVQTLRFSNGTQKPLSQSRLSKHGSWKAPASPSRGTRASNGRAASKSGKPPPVSRSMPVPRSAPPPPPPVPPPSSQASSQPQKSHSPQRIPMQRPLACVSGPV